MALLWHSAQATCFEKVGPPAAPVSRCFRCAPTFTPVEAPEVSRGGAAEKATRSASAPVRVASPWHDVHDRAAYSTVPFTWVAALTVVEV